MNNRALACHLRAHAVHLEHEQLPLYRIRAYRKAADTIEGYERPLAEVYQDEGRAGLEALPDVGRHLAYTLEGLLTTGEFRTLRPEGSQREPDRLLTSLPGIGAQLALRLREQLGITTLDELEQAGHAGRLAEVGIGPRRLHTLLTALVDRRRRPAVAEGEPSIDELLRLDGEFRRQGPRPLQKNQGAYRYRAAFCARALAQRLDQTRDWVEIRFQRDDQEGERLVVTEREGDLAGRRIVRGREAECREYYRTACQPALTA